MSDCVIFKAEKECFRVVFKEDADFDAILEETEKKLHRAKRFFVGQKMRLAYTGKELTKEQEDTIKQCFESITDTHIIDIVPYQPKEKKKILRKRKAKKTSQSSVLQEKPMTETDNNNLSNIQADEQSDLAAAFKMASPNESMQFHIGTLRSGRLLQARTHAVVIGDVNPGAEVKAGGNIVVMGTIKGLVHAGLGGKNNAIVAAYRLKPTQIRIGDLITRPPDQPETDVPDEPEVAHIQDEQIVIDPLSVYIK